MDNQRKEQIERIETLNGLMERLCSSDLTLGESKILRAKLATLIDRSSRDNSLDREAPNPPQFPIRVWHQALSGEAPLEGSTFCVFG